MIKLDAYDKKIIDILLNNSREQLSSISKKVRLKRENVDYKIRRLVKSKLIKEFNTEFNEEKLDIKHHTIFVQLVNLKENKEKEILNYLKDHPYISWIGVLAGKWSLTFDIFITKNTNLGNILKEITSNFGDYIDNYVVLNLEESGYYSNKYLDLKSKEFNKIIKEEKVELDETDYKILSLLNKSSRTTYVEISKVTKLTPNGIKKRVKNLEQNKIINSYNITLNFKELGYEWYGIQLKLSKFSEEVEKKLKSFFKNHKKVLFYYRYIGDWDYDIGIIAKNSNELRNFINELRTNFPEEIKINDVSLILEEVTGYKLPKGIFEKNL
ncbi:MAG: Lrp/AsnC family transcriptional regulator [Nanoarchaeota archaeon]|nr:Lrp/AsnC family transcriptional regulator [Nanoarchaeota archaeon]